MPAKSKAQQRLMGMAYAHKMGRGKKPSKEIDMSLDKLKEFASTKHKGLPKRKTK